MYSSPSPSQVEIKEFLRPILLGLSEEDLDELARSAVKVSLPPGTIICREGDPGELMYFIIEGSVEILKQVTDDIERRLHAIGAGEYFGEMAILQQGPRTATVRTVEPTVLLEVGQAPFLRVLGRSPSLGVRILIRMTNRLRDADQQAIEELRQANEELSKALHQLERLDRTKSDFIRVSAHELRTPVAALLGYIQMIQADASVQESPDLRVLVEGVNTATQRLHRVFNSILDLSRLITDGIEVIRSPVSVPVVFEGIRLEFEPAMRERRLEFELLGLKGLPTCAGDPDLLYKVFYHLVNNAVKYTKDGGRITVTGETIEFDGEGPCIQVAVEDTGIGIAAEDLDLIFEKFYRTGEVALHSSGTTKFKGGGPGLGLAIARGIVLAHKGRIWAESPGYDEECCPGSRFVVQLPLDSMDQ